MTINDSHLKILKFTAKLLYKTNRLKVEKYSKSLHACELNKNTV